jgi:hypothetical protein
MKITNINKFFFKSIILLICSYELDKNKNYKSFLSNDKIKNCLQSSKVNSDIILYIYSKLNLSGKFYYLKNNVDVQCMIFVRNNKLYLIFCGTNVNNLLSFIKDWNSNLNLKMIFLEEFGNSIGIQQSYKTNMHCEYLIDNIQKIIKKNINHKIIICGHSLGCGYASYTSIYLSKQFPNKKAYVIIPYIDTEDFTTDNESFDKCRKIISKIKMIITRIFYVNKMASLFLDL